MKRALKIVGIVFLLFLVLILTILMQSVTPEQQKSDSEAFFFPSHIQEEQLDLDSLWRVVGTNKSVPKGYELAALVAYSAYPELKNTKIEMILTESGAPMEASFDLFTMFGSEENRTYQILLNDADQTSYDPILLRNLPFNAQVGILAHELGHVAYYRKLSTLQISKWGLMYLISSEFRAMHERTTDLMPVYHGLGFQIYEYARYVRHDPSTQPLYDQFEGFMDRFYMTDVEILEVLSNYEHYNLQLKKHIGTSN